MVRLVYPAAAFSSLEFVQHHLLYFLRIAPFEHADVDIAGKGQFVGIFSSEFNHVKSCLGLQRIVSIQSHFDEVAIDCSGVAAAMIYGHQVILVT